MGLQEGGKTAGDTEEKSVKKKGSDASTRKRKRVGGEDETTGKEGKEGKAAEKNKKRKKDGLKPIITTEGPVPG